MNSHFWWYLSRSAGTVAWVLVLASCAWGILLVTRLFRGYDRPAWLLDLHKWFGTLLLAKHQGIQSLGEVMSVGIATCMIAGLTFLPALLSILTRHGWTLKMKK